MPKNTRQFCCGHRWALKAEEDRQDVAGIGDNICFTGVTVGTAGPIVPTVAVAKYRHIPATSCLFFFPLERIYVRNKMS